MLVAVYAAGVASEQHASPSAEAKLTVWSLHVDGLTAELMRGFAERGVPFILLKGPAIARWLYDDGSVRPYADCDLLVDPRQITAAQAILRERGFEDTASPLAHPRKDSHEWQRAQHHVDLHTTLIGIRAAPQEVWDALSSTTDSEQVGGMVVRVLDRPGRTLHVALHAAQHGRDEEKPLEDLRRALELVPEQTWRDAADLARRLRATEAFATGLRLLPAGSALATRLDLVSAASAEATLRLEPVPLALALEHLAETRGWRARLDILWRELFPTVAFMRWWSPLARRGRLGLIAAYCWRPLYLLLHLGPGFVAWQRARRGAAR